jgi:hypothetical protein
MVRTWDWRTAELERAVPNHFSLFSLDLTSDSRRVAAQGHFFKVIDWPSGTPITPDWLPPQDKRPYWGVAVSADDKQAIIGGFFAKLTAYDLEAINRPAAMAVDELGTVAEIISSRRIMPEGNVVTIDTDGWINSWNGFRQHLDARSSERLEQGSNRIP